MAASLIGWIWSQSVERNLSTGARLTLFALNEHTSIGTHGDWRVFPGQHRLAKMVGCSEFTLRKHLKELTEAELLTVANQFDNSGRQQANLYWLQAPKLVEEEGERNLLPPERNVPHGGQETCDKPLNKNPFNKHISESFDAFWALYPRKVSKKPAFSRWKKMSDKKRSLALEAVKSYPFESEIKYVKHPSTWLNEECWNDEFPDAPKKKWSGV